MLIETTISQISRYVIYLNSVVDNHEEQEPIDMIDRIRYSVQGILLQTNHLEELTDKTSIKGKKLTKS